MPKRVLVVIAAIVLVIVAGMVLSVKRSLKASASRDPAEMGQPKQPPPAAR
ncbi:MAG: hypothetical protein ACXWG1_10730 [Usitatibacter sp.]